MTRKTMSEDAFQALVARLHAGERVPHTRDLGLYPVTTCHRSELSAEGAGFVWTTYFVEHAGGHGSRDLTEQKRIDEAGLRALLADC